MIRSLAHRLDSDARFAPRRLLTILAPTGLFWLVMQHAPYWFVLHVGHAFKESVGPESRYAQGELRVAGEFGYLLAAALMSIATISALRISMARRVGTHPLVFLALVPAWFDAVIFIVTLPLAYVALPLYVAYHITLLVARALNGRALIARLIVPREPKLPTNVIRFPAGDAHPS